MELPKLNGTTICQLSFWCGENSEYRARITNLATNILPNIAIDFQKKLEFTLSTKSVQNSRNFSERAIDEEMGIVTIHNL